MAQNIEYQHRENMSRAYNLYSVLRDFYKYAKHKKMKHIGKFISEKFTDSDYIYNKNKLEEAYKIASKYLTFTKKTCKDANVIGSINENMKYIKRIIDLFRELIINNNLNKLRYEMKLELKEIELFENDINSLPLQS